MSMFAMTAAAGGSRHRLPPSSVEVEARANSAEGVVQHLTIHWDPLTRLLDEVTGKLLPGVLALLEPRFQPAQRIERMEASQSATRLSTLMDPSNHARHVRLERITSRRISGRAQDAKSLQQYDDGWGVYTTSAANTENDNEWLVEVGFGNPVQTLKMVLDTGSPDTWVYSPTCCYGADHADFDPSESSSYTNRTIGPNGRARPAAPGSPGSAWNISYGGGSSTQGFIGLDTFSFSATSHDLTTATLPLALATAITGTTRSNRAMEGIIGLSNGGASLAPGGWTTPLEHFAQTRRLKNPYLTASFIKADRRTGLGGGGSYILGDVDNLHQDGPVVWTDVTSAIYWGADFDDMLLGGHSLFTDEGASRRMIMDTGSALINLPPKAAKSANSRIQGSLRSGDSAYWLVPCRTGLPEYEAALAPENRNQAFTLVLEAKSFVVNPEDFVFYPNQPVLTPATGQEDMCISAFQAGPEAFSIIGATFIKNHAVTFDVAQGVSGGRRIGVANRTDIEPLQ